LYLGIFFQIYGVTSLKLASKGVIFMAQLFSQLTSPMEAQLEPFLGCIYTGAAYIAAVFKTASN
jgi:hypothetical protein